MQDKIKFYFTAEDYSGVKSVYPQEVSAANK